METKAEKKLYAVKFIKDGKTWNSKPKNLVEAVNMLRYGRKHSPGIKHSLVVL